MDRTVFQSVAVEAYRKGIGPDADACELQVELFGSQEYGLATSY